MEVKARDPDADADADAEGNGLSTLEVLGVVAFVMILSDRGCEGLNRLLAAPLQSDDCTR